MRDIDLRNKMVNLIRDELDRAIDYYLGPKYQKDLAKYLVGYLADIDILLCVIVLKPSVYESNKTQLMMIAQNLQSRYYHLSACNSEVSSLDIETTVLDVVRRLRDIVKEKVPEWPEILASILQKIPVQYKKAQP